MEKFQIIVSENFLTVT